MNQLKTCTLCQVPKPVDDFRQVQENRGIGAVMIKLVRRPHCKICERKQNSLGKRGSYQRSLARDPHFREKRNALARQRYYRIKDTEAYRKKIKASGQRQNQRRKEKRRLKCLQA